MNLKQQVINESLEFNQVMQDTYTHINLAVFQSDKVMRFSSKVILHLKTIFWRSNALCRLGGGYEMFVDSWLMEDICCSQDFACSSIFYWWKNIKKAFAHSPALWSAHAPISYFSHWNWYCQCEQVKFRLCTVHSTLQYVVSVIAVARGYVEIACSIA